MVTGMMERDPEQRLTAQQALATPWIAGEGLGRTADIGANVIAPLREWQSVRGFDKAVIGVVAGILESQEGAELDEIRAAFETVDADGSGHLDRKDLEYYAEQERRRREELNGAKRRVKNTVFASGRFHRAGKQRAAKEEGKV